MNRNTLHLGCFLFLMVGCSDLRTAAKPDPFAADRQRLVGTWRMDVRINEELVDQLLDGDPDRKQSFEERSVRGMAKQLLGNKLDDLTKKVEQTASNSMELQFFADGTWSSKTALAVARGQKSGTWTIHESNAESMLVSCTWKDEKSAQSETSDTRVTFLGPDRMRLVPPNMAGVELELTFAREPAK
ncbi:MAG: hypothetical protein Q8M16_13530 [Pirellulaceae bacterium]|nr:hypothetical protein [Pirellulaceae bacterium]